MISTDQRAARKLGIVRDMPAHTYHAIRAASSTTLRALMRSPAHAMQQMTAPADPTPDLIFGDACHLAVLQPELFATRYVTADQCQGITGKGSRCTNAGKVCRTGEWFCLVHDTRKGAPDDDGRTVLAQDDFDRAQAVADSVRKHPAARELLEQRTDTELSAFWLDPETGVYCKARADLMLANVGILGDLKTTRDASPEEFAKSVWSYRYDLQCAHYLKVFAGCRSLCTEFRFIAVEKEPPFAAAVYSLSVDDIMPALDDLDRLLATWRDCDATEGGWQRAYGDGVLPITLPAWATKNRKVSA